jgi:hypothetical protein
VRADKASTACNKNISVCHLHIVNERISQTIYDPAGIKFPGEET